MSGSVPPTPGPVKTLKGGDPSHQHVLRGRHLVAEVVERRSGRSSATLRATVQATRGYLSSTVAPAPSSCVLALSACSLRTRSSTGLGAESTRSLASFRPRLG